MALESNNTVRKLTVVLKTRNPQCGLHIYLILSLRPLSEVLHYIGIGLKHKVVLLSEKTMSLKSQLPRDLENGEEIPRQKD